ncbi:hypothetical protein Tco_0995305 [Tanacetum coccineum]
MSEEDQVVGTTVLPKFDMSSYESTMTAKDVKSLALRHGIPLDLHPVALTKGWTMDKLLDDMIGLYEKLKGWKKRFFFLERRAIPDAMAWRHHDSDINNPVPADGFSASYVQVLIEWVVDLRPVPSRLLFQGGLATTWNFPGFRPIFKDTEGNGNILPLSLYVRPFQRILTFTFPFTVVTMSEYLRFPFLSGASISKGPAFTSQDQIPQHTIRILPSDQTISEKTDHQKGIEVEDPKIVATRERKARVAAKKREKGRQGGDGGEGSRPTTKKRKTIARKDGTAASEVTSSPEPLRTINPTDPSGAVAETAELREDRSPRISPHGSANHSVHNYSDAQHDNEKTDTLWLGTSGDQSGRVMTNVNTEVVQPSPTHQSAYHSLIATQSASPPCSYIFACNVEEGESSRGEALYVLDWSIHQRCRLDTPMWCRELMVYLAPPATQEESNAFNNATSLERAWLAETHSECGETVGKLVKARLDLTHSSHLYTTLSDRYKTIKSEHEGYAGKLEVLESHNSELSQVNKDHAFRIKELEDELARKDSALVYAERLNVERAQEKEKLVAQLSKTDMEKFDCIRKLLPTVVERLLQSHEYKHSLSEPFNLAIQAGWGKGLSEERSEEDLLELMSRMENFDISLGIRHSVSDLLKVYPDSPPFGQAPPSKPSSGKGASTSAPRES